MDGRSIYLFILQCLLEYTVYFHGPAVFKEPYIVVLICILYSPDFTVSLSSH